MEIFRFHGFHSLSMFQASQPLYALCFGLISLSIFQAYQPLYALCSGLHSLSILQACQPLYTSGFSASLSSRFFSFPILQALPSLVDSGITLVFFRNHLDAAPGRIATLPCPFPLSSAWYSSSLLSGTLMNPVLSMCMKALAPTVVSFLLRI